MLGTPQIQKSEAIDSVITGSEKNKLELNLDFIIYVSSNSFILLLDVTYSLPHQHPFSLSGAFISHEEPTDEI